MGKIKFSHVYRKLFEGKGDVMSSATLLQIFKTDFSDLTAEFLEYDTDGVYRLPAAGPCIVLLLQKPSRTHDLFTTVRPYTPEKLEYYTKMIGTKLDIQII